MSRASKQCSYLVILLVLAPSSSFIAGALIGLPGTKAIANQTDSIDAATPLSVAPLDHVEYPEDRPEWVKQTVKVADQTATVVVVSGPSESQSESLEELRVMQRAAVDAVVVQVTGHPNADEFFSISDEEIDRDLVRRRYVGYVLQGDASKVEHAVELHFGAKILQAMVAAEDQLKVRNRLGAIGVAAVGGLFALIGSSALIGIALRRTSPLAESKGS